jgi:hypothetical protein
MDIVLRIVGLAVGFGGSFWAGYRYGERCRRLPQSRYWIANVVGMLLGMVLAMLGSGFGLPWLWIGSLGVMVGSISGLKYGLGRSVGIWRLMDGPGGKGPKP